MRSGALDDQYFSWLYSLVADVRIRKGRRTHWNLLRMLFSIEFAWFVPNDDNRAEDGRELRSEWISSRGIQVESSWIALGCSFLEMLIGVSRRLDFLTDEDSTFWFWHLIGNMGLLDHHDGKSLNEEEVEDSTSMVIWRTYDCDGNGGLFPLRYTDKDQRKVEIWRQLNEYLLQDG
jgi:hypothetical protein